jgi:hypothetical protein
MSLSSYGKFFNFAAPFILFAFCAETHAAERPMLREFPPLAERFGPEVDPEPAIPISPLQQEKVELQSINPLTLTTSSPVVSLPHTGAQTPLHRITLPALFYRGLPSQSANSSSSSQQTPQVINPELFSSQQEVMQYLFPNNPSISHNSDDEQPSVNELSISHNSDNEQFSVSDLSNTFELTSNEEEKN